MFLKLPYLSTMSQQFCRLLQPAKTAGLSSLLAAKDVLAARNEERRLFSRLPCRIGNNTEQDTQEVKSVCAPFHLSTEGCEGKEYSDPPSQPTSKSEPILFVSTFRHLFSPGLRLVPSQSDFPYLITLNCQKTFRTSLDYYTHFSRCAGQ